MSDIVERPSHYQLSDGIEAIQVIASALTKEEFHGYCLGNTLKYRLRAGKKNEIGEDINKANYYQELYKKHSYLCRPTRITGE